MQDLLTMFIACYNFPLQKRDSCIDSCFNLYFGGGYLNTVKLC